MKETPDPNSPQPSSDKREVIPFTEAQLAGLTARKAQYFGEANRQMNHDLELAVQLDDRVQAAVKAGKRVTVDLNSMTGFICE